MIRWILSLALLGFLAPPSTGQLVIAHRGACGYLPEHTLVAKSLAHGMGADFIEQDVVLTRDGQPIILHDIYLDTVSDVARKFSDRARSDGRYYAVDFQLQEIKTLRVSERFRPENGKAVYPSRFPVGQGGFRVPTLAEELTLIQGLNRSTGRSVGVYVEIKQPAWHRREHLDISRVVLDVLTKFGYRTQDDQAILQCFDPDELPRLRNELGTQLRLVQLIGKPDASDAPANSRWLRTTAGIRNIATYADGIGPWLPLVVEGVDDRGKAKITSLVADAHAAGLFVHPYTFRADDLPDYAQSLEEVLAIFLTQARVDGVFTDFPDRAVQFFHSRRQPGP